MRQAIQAKTNISVLVTTTILHPDIPWSNPGSNSEKSVLYQRSYLVSKFNVPQAFKDSKYVAVVAIQFQFPKTNFILV